MNGELNEHSSDSEDEIWWMNRNQVYFDDKVFVSSDSIFSEFIFQEFPFQRFISVRLVVADILICFPGVFPS